MPKVNYIRAEVEDLMPRWIQIKDCIAGSPVIKSKEKQRLYLVDPNTAVDASTNDKAKKRFEQYLRRAVFYGVLERTLNGMLGEVFSKDPVTELPANLEVLKADVDGANVTLVQQSRKAMSHALAHGRGFLLTDYPKLELAEGEVRAFSQSDLDEKNIRPTIKLFDPWDVINWRIKTVGGKQLLSLVVISEREVVDDDGFETEFNEYYRVLRLRQGIYANETWKYDEDQNDFIRIGLEYPTQANGKFWNEIPGTFFGSQNNDSIPDLPPMYAMSVLNIGHYNNSAQYEDLCFQLSQCLPWFSGVTEDWVRNVWKGELYIGDGSVVPLPPNSQAGLLQVGENTLAFEAMQHKEKQMAALGADLIEQRIVQATATESGHNRASKTSVLSTCASNVSSAYTQCLLWAEQFSNSNFKESTEDDEDIISYSINTEYSFAKLTAQEQTQLVANWQARAITFEEMRFNFVRAGIAYLKDADAREQLENEEPSFSIPSLEGEEEEEEEEGNE